MVSLYKSAYERISATENRLRRCQLSVRYILRGKSVSGSENIGKKLCEKIRNKQ